MSLRLCSTTGLLLDLESKYFYLLNPSGWAMTQLFERPASIDHVVERCREWGATDADVEGVERPWTR